MAPEKSGAIIFFASPGYNFPFNRLLPGSPSTSAPRLILPTRLGPSWKMHRVLTFAAEHGTITQIEIIWDPKRLAVEPSRHEGLVGRRSISLRFCQTG